MIKRVLGIDYGDARIGIAISDLMGWTAQAVETIKWNHHLDEPLNRIVKLRNNFV